MRRSGATCARVRLALGATRFETIFKVLLPCAKSGIAVAVILGLMRVVGETMVVWMASGNSLKIPEPFYNFLEPVRTLTATIAGEMGEADQSTGSDRYHVLFAMSLCLLLGGLLLNAADSGSGRALNRKENERFKQKNFGQGVYRARVFLAWQRWRWRLCFSWRR